MEQTQQDENKRDEVRFEVIKSQEISFGDKGDFIEIAKKKAITSEGENEFISLSRGYIIEGSKRFRKGKTLSLPVNEEVVEGVIEGLKKVIS